MQLREVGRAQAVTTITMRRTVDSASGATVVRLVCDLWVYNCSGLPIALQQVRHLPPSAKSVWQHTHHVNDRNNRSCLKC